MQQKRALDSEANKATKAYRQMLTENDKQSNLKMLRQQHLQTFIPTIHQQGRKWMIQNQINFNLKLMQRQNCKLVGMAIHIMMKYNVMITIDNMMTCQYDNINNIYAIIHQILIS